MLGRIRKMFFYKHSLVDLLYLSVVYMKYDGCVLRAAWLILLQNVEYCMLILVFRNIFVLSFLNSVSMNASYVVFSL